MHIGPFVKLWTNDLPRRENVKHEWHLLSDTALNSKRTQSDEECLIPDPSTRQGTSSCLWYSETGDQDVGLIYNRGGRRLRCLAFGSSAVGWVQRVPSLKVHLCILSLAASHFKPWDIRGSCLEAPQRPGGGFDPPAWAALTSTRTDAHTHTHLYVVLTRPHTLDIVLFPPDGHADSCTQTLTHTHTYIYKYISAWICPPPLNPISHPVALQKAIFKSIQFSLFV